MADSHTTDRDVAIKSMRNAGLTFRQIGKAIGVSFQRVHQLTMTKRLPRNGLPKAQYVLVGPRGDIRMGSARPNREIVVAVVAP